MSKLGVPGGDDYPEAAGKNLQDAQSLLAANRHDGAAYHAGFVVECALKTLVLLELGNARAFGHDIHRLSTEALRLASIPSAKTARYIPKIAVGHFFYDPKTGWNENLRYRAPGAVAPKHSQQWVEEAKSVYESTVVPMLLDGVL